MERQHYYGAGGPGRSAGGPMRPHPQNEYWPQYDPIPGGGPGPGGGHHVNVVGGGDERDRLAHQPTADLVKDGIEQGKRLLREEANLIAADLKKQAKTAGAGLGTAAAGGVVLHAGFLVLCAMVVLALSTVMAGWLAALLTGVALVVIGAVMAKGGIAKAKHARPDTAIHELEEDKRWASDTMHAMKSRKRVNA